jgi:isopenicillin-N epimerase
MPAITGDDTLDIVVVDIPLEVSGPDALFQRMLASVTPRTRFAVIDHVPSRSGLIFPIKELVSELTSLNIDTLVDGAHAPGMIPLDITDIKAAYYVANCHKWMCVPRGVGLLVSQLATIRPPLVRMHAP